MSFVLRAITYVRRKWKKTILLSGVFCITAFTMLGTWEVLKVSGQISTLMRKESNSKMTIESMNMKNPIRDEDVERIRALGNISKINRAAKITVFANGFLAVPGANDRNEVVLHGFDDMLKDSPFDEKICRIVSGREAIKDGEIVINQRLAELNQTALNDEMSFICDENTYMAKVVGFYLTGNENNQTDVVLTENRIENQIYTVESMVLRMRNTGFFEKIIAYVDNPEHLAETEHKITEMFQDKASVRTLDTAYQKIRFSISGTKRATKIIFVFTAVTSIFVTGSLLILWMRNRKTEIAVFISLGIRKIEIFLQMLVEILLTWSISAALAALSGQMLFPGIGDEAEVIRDMDISVSVSFSSVCGLFLVGVMVLLILNVAAVCPYFIKKPKEILSEMED